MHSPTWLRAADMTPRARAYLTVAGLRHIGVGLCTVVAPAAFTTTSLAQIRDIMALPLWGSGMLIVGCLCLLAALRESEPLARVSLICSAAASTTWTAGFTAALLTDQLSNPALPIIFGALAAKDLIVCAQPLRSPFERLTDDLSR